MILIKKWLKEILIKELKVMINYPLIITSINIITAIFYGIDKLKAIKKKERISEIALLTISAIAPFGALFGMIFFHHKTKKLKFKISILLFLIINFLLYLNYFV